MPSVPCKILSIPPSERLPGEIVAHPDQFAHVLPAATARRRPQPLGHQVPAPVVAQRSAAQYDALYGVEVFA